MNISEIYDIIGEEAIIDIVTKFYEMVENDKILRPLYRNNLSIPRQHLIIYLIQKFGGPRLYEEERGQPKLKFRHVPFAIGQEERDRWMELMKQALNESNIDSEASKTIVRFFSQLSTNLINNKLFTIQGTSD